MAPKHSIGSRALRLALLLLQTVVCVSAVFAADNAKRYVDQYVKSWLGASGVYPQMRGEVDPLAVGLRRCSTSLCMRPKNHGSGVWYANPNPQDTRYERPRSRRG
jgi:hypothetical protein